MTAVDEFKRDAHTAGWRARLMIDVVLELIGRVERLEEIDAAEAARLRRVLDASMPRRFVARDDESEEA